MEAVLVRFEHRDSSRTVHASRIYRDRVIERPRDGKSRLLYSRLACWPENLAHQRKERVRYRLRDAHRAEPHLVSVESRLEAVGKLTENLLSSH